MSPSPPKLDALDDMECGSSLAENVWTSLSSGNDAETSNDAASAAVASSRCSTKSPTMTAEEAWDEIRRLRSYLAGDVIVDPPSQNATSPSPHPPLPTFTSPFQAPPSRPHQPPQPHRGTPIPLIYCDHTASHRPLSSIERYLRTASLPCHANTHTNITYTGSQSTAFVAEARQIVAEATHARVTGKAGVDAVLFAGNGVTGAVGLLIDCLNVRGWVDVANSRPVVFAGPHEHHSNLLPWRESGCQVVAVPARRDDDMVDLRELDRLLRLPEYGAESNRLRIGAFSAASNVTGIVADVDAIAVVLHRHGALAFFDYASGAPYCGMDMNPNPPAGATYEDYLNGDVRWKFSEGKGDSSRSSSSSSSPPPNPSKDALYFSPHKCFGGTSTPGVLVVKKHLVSQTNPPSVAGGGTVFYVTNTDHRFLSNRIERYEGGTPDGIGIQRVGLAMLVGRRVGREFERIVHSVAKDPEENNDGCVEGDEPRDGEKTTEKIPRPLPKSLLEFECSTYDRIVSELKKHAPNLIVLGTTPPKTNDRPSSNPHCIGRHLPIFSFLIRCGRRFLHYNYVCAILNDIFGIQSRGGCQCAGPYSQRLLGLTKVVVTTTAATTNGQPTQRTVQTRNEVPTETNRNFERALLRSDRPCELLRPGYTRLSLPFKGLRDEEVEYVLRALVWVAANGWALLPQYRCDHRTGEWRHWSRRGKPLGKTERRWLSHFDVLEPRASVRLGDGGEGVDGRGRDIGDGRGEEDSYEEMTRISRARLEQAMKNADAILKEAKSNPRYVSEVEKMNPVDGMLGSGGGNDPGAGDMDDTLEQLRWYVYQRECAPYLRDGLDQVPETMDDDALLGGIYVRMDGKKRVLEEVCELVEETNDTMEAEPASVEQSQPIVSHSLVPESGLIPFREDEHMGEAPYDEIKAGFDDGELTDQCVLYHTIKDEWVPIEEFILEYESNTQDKSRKRDLSTMTESGSNDPGMIQNPKESMDIDESPSCDGIHSMKIDSATPTATDIDVRPPAKLPAAVQKREKKKPSRDSSQWGQSSAPHIVPATSCAIGSCGFQNGGNDGSNAEGQEGPVPSGAKSIESMETVPVEAKSKNSIKKGGKVKPPPKMMRNITQAMVQWDMIQEGDRLLLGLSGGKDSLSLLHCLLEFQRKLPTKFEIEVCTIDPMTPSFDPSPLIPYVESLGLKYHYIRDDIVERANSAGKDGKTVSSLCAFCARMKRGNLYNCARKNNCNKLVLAQHLDDCAESFLMSVMHNGFVRTMKANYRINAGDISVIRPLVYCRESLMTEFAKEANLPVINENCPACFEEPKERARVKKLLSREETLYPNLYDHIRRALIPIMHDDSTAILRSYLEETVAKSRKVPYQGRKGKGKSNNDGSSEEKKDSELPSNPVAEESASPSASISLASATEEQLVAELARRRAAKFALSGAMKRLPGGDGDDEDPTGQVCSLLGGNGTIPCRELME